LVNAVEFNLDGQVLATASRDKTARLWDRQGRELARLNHEEEVMAVVFSPNGQVLATASNDKTARLKHDDKVYSIIFSPDGQVLATASGKTTQLWLRRQEDLIAEACRRLDRNLTETEWRQYLGEEPYRKTCGEK
jgi:WD40 repeat protein